MCLRHVRLSIPPNETTALVRLYGGSQLKAPSSYTIVMCLLHDSTAGEGRKRPSYTPDPCSA